MTTAFAGLAHSYRAAQRSQRLADKLTFTNNPMASQFSGVSISDVFSIPEQHNLDRIQPI
jgi:hypothetical protein